MDAGGLAFGTATTLAFFQIIGIFPWRTLALKIAPGVFQLCLWPLRAPGYLGEDYHVSHQPSDASTLTSWRLQQHEESGSTRLTYSRSRLHEISVVRRCVCRPEWEFRTRCQRITTSTTAVHIKTSAVLRHTTKRQQNNNNTQWLKWFCEAGGSPDEARLEQTPYPFQPTNLALFSCKIALYRFNQGARTIAGGGGSNGSRGLSTPSPPHFNNW